MSVLLVKDLYRARISVDWRAHEIATTLQAFVAVAVLVLVVVFVLSRQEESM